MTPSQDAAARAPAPEPVRSMTGVGTHALDHALGRLEAEARSVNQRFLKVSLRTQGPLPDLLAEAEERVRARVQRGHVSLLLRFTPAPAAPGASIDPAAFAAAARELAHLTRVAGLAAPSAGDVLRMPGLVATSSATPAQSEALAAAALQAVEGALAQMEGARRREGGVLACEVTGLLDRIERAVHELAARAAEVPQALQERLRARLAELLQGTGASLDPAALAHEVAALADRSDVREELARLCAHVGHAREILARGGSVGRQMDFLAQEFAREANTVGSKANDLALTRTVIGLKADVERLREQVQNLE
ncbi:MAG: YicC/YloC family endoribonuclease [Planctomycetia bacterium]